MKKFEPPRVELVGNMHDLVAQVCHPSPPTYHLGMDPALPGSETWVVEVGVEGRRLLVYPLAGIAGPYRVDVQDAAGGLVMVRSGARTVREAMGAAAEHLASLGVRVNRNELETFGRNLDDVPDTAETPPETAGAARRAPRGPARGGSPR